MHDHTHGDDCGCGQDPEAKKTDGAEEEVLKCVSDFVSRNQNYKAAVYDLGADPAKFEVAIYQWQEAKEETVWERIAGPIIMDTQPAAETWAQENLAVYAGEKIDATVGDQMRGVVYKTLGHDNFDFLDPRNYQVSFLESEDSEEFLPLPGVDKLLVAGDFYFVEFKGRWLAGFLYDEANVRCWKSFEALESALLGIAN